MCKDFSHKEHMTCAVCKFEVMYVKPPVSGYRLGRIYYVFKDGTPDIETEEIDLDSNPTDIEGIFCNSKKCNIQLSSKLSK